MTLVVPLDQKRLLASRIIIGNYYADGRSVVEVERIGSTGCIEFRDIRGGDSRCLDVTEFRRLFWLVAESQAA